MFDVDPGRENTFDVIRQFYVLVDSHFKEKKQVPTDLRAIRKRTGDRD